MSSEPREPVDGHAEEPETVEFEAIESDPDRERIEFELVGHQRVPIKADFKEPIELRFGRDEQTPSCYLIRSPSHLGRAGEWAIVQPEVVRNHPGRGWVTFGRSDVLKIGRQASPQFEFGPNVSRMHCLVAETGMRDDSETALEIENYGRNGLRVLAHPDDLLGGIEVFTPSEEGT